MATSEAVDVRLRELRTSLDALPEVSEPPKPTLRILGSMRAEQSWNALLAYFLDPSQPHGFGADLLKAFLDTARRETHQEIEYFHRDLEAVSIETEVTSPQDNRLDIVIRAQGTWFVCIELKVDAPEGDEQTLRYVQDPQLGAEPKEDYPEDGQHYVFLSKKYAADATACDFGDLSWQAVVEAFRECLRSSRGRYPARSVNQLQEFLDTITEVCTMDEDVYTETQKEKVRLLAEYKQEIDELVEATNQVRERAIDVWPERFRNHVPDDQWTKEWHTRPGKWGIIYRDGWYRDGDLNPTHDVPETRGNDGVRLHFMHNIRNEDSFLEGKLTFELICNTSVPVRDEFYRLYKTDQWQERFEPELERANIVNRGNKSTYTHKTYDVDQSRLPESYFTTLATAFEEHRPLGDLFDELLEEAVENVKTT